MEGREGSVITDYIFTALLYYIFQSSLDMLLILFSWQLYFFFSVSKRLHCLQKFTECLKTEPRLTPMSSNSNSPPVADFLLNHAEDALLSVLSSVASSKQTDDGRRREARLSLT